MIKENAIKIIEQLLKDEEEQGDIFFTDEDKDALKFAIKELSASTVEPRIEYGTDGRPYKLSMTNGKEYERLQSKWIIVKDEKWGDNVKCLFCGKELAGTDLNFCCKCGADMRKDKYD